MSATVPVFAVAALVVLSMVARELNYFLTSASLVAITGAVIAGLVAIQWMFG